MPLAAMCIVEQHLSPAAAACVLRAADETAAAGAAGQAGDGATQQQATALGAADNGRHLLLGVLGDGSSASEEVLRVLQAHGITADALRAWAHEQADGEAAVAGACGTQHFQLEAFRWALYTQV